MLMRELGENWNAASKFYRLQEASFLVAIEEKIFSSSDEADDFIGKPEQRTSQIQCLIIARSKGDRQQMIFKGEASISILYQSMENTLA
jgi:hypothetical protein